MDVASLKSLLLEAGTGWILWLLAGLSVISLALVVERWLTFRAKDTNLEVLARGLDERLSAGETARAIEDLRRSPSLAAAIAAAGLRLADRGPEAVDKAMRSATALERSRLERGLAFLGTLGNNAPFIGLFGTVIGIIDAFEHLGQGGSSGAASQAASAAIMASIAEALVATAVGLLVALPAVAAYNYFQRRIARLLSGSEVLTNLVLAYLADRGAPAVVGESPPREPRGVPVEVARGG